MTPSANGPAQNDYFPMRTVSANTGVNPVTLRAWERRYGQVTPDRTPRSIVFTAMISLDPISLDDVTDIKNAPCLIEGSGDNDLKIYFEPEHNRQEYLAKTLHGSDGGSTALNGIYNAISESPITGSINQANRRLQPKEKHHEQLRNPDP